MMIFMWLGLLLLLGTANGEPKIVLKNEPWQIHMDEVVTIPFSIKELNISEDKINITANSSDSNIAKIGSPKFEVRDGIYTGSFNVSGVFLGKAEVSLILNYGEVPTVSSVNIIVIRKVRLVDTLFTASVAALCSILYINFGCALDWEICAKTLKRPIGPLIGCLCQFIIMPLISFVLGLVLFPESPEMQLGIFFTGISPSGGASNIWTMLLGGNLNLSVTMTTLCMLAAFGLMPMWIFTLGKHIFERGNLSMPYGKVATISIGLVIPLAIGYFIQKKFPKLSKVMIRMMKPFSVVLILFIVIFAIVTNLYLFQLFSWKIVLAGLGLPWLGYVFGLTFATMFRQSDKDCRAISIETGIQNTGVAIFLLRFSLDQPAADLTTVVPVSCAIMTPLPLIVLFCIKLVLDRRKPKFAGSNEKLQNAPQVTPLSA